MVEAVGSLPEVLEPETLFTAVVALEVELGSAADCERSRFAGFALHSAGSSMRLSWASRPDAHQQQQGDAYVKSTQPPSTVCHHGRWSIRTSALGGVVLGLSRESNASCIYIS